MVIYITMPRRTNYMADIVIKSQTYAEIGKRISGDDHDNQTYDIISLNNAKANKDEVQKALDTKADAQATTEALNNKADIQMVTEALNNKADAQATQQALNKRATTGQLTDVLNQSFINAIVFG